MHMRLIGILKHLVSDIGPLLLVLASIMMGSIAHAGQLSQEQQTYLDARKALDKKQTKEYARLRTQLADYPLSVYLDYHANIKAILTYKGIKADKALQQFNDTPLFNSARHRYLKHVGAQKRWADFLTISPTPPNNVTLQCYYYRAELFQGNKEQAYKGAKSLWLYGKSRPKECDPLFKAWQKSGGMTQELIWSRMLLSFNANQYGLLTYLSRKVTSQQQTAKTLVAVYKDPRSLRHIQKYSTSAKNYADIVDAGLRKLARKDLKQAVKLYASYQKTGRFSDYQGRKLSRYLVRRAVIRQEEQLKGFVDTMLPLLDSDDLVELRLRWAIRENDSQTITTTLPLLSEQKQAKSRWQYWQSREKKNHSAADSKMLNDLSQQRNFYGFSAANELNLAYQLQDELSVSDTLSRQKLADDSGLSRVIELLALDKTIDARAEWVLMLRRHNKMMQKEYAVLALENQWHSLGVQASIQGKLWNDMTIRFPYAANDEFTKASKQYQVNIDEIRAIARRESAFYSYATSGAGARGLMQLMPATAKETAKKQRLKYKNKRSLYQANINIPLGSAYYSSLLKQFNNNRVLATAAYNAGPHRVKGWLKVSDGQLDVIEFIESLPFTETREYVQAVLSYRVIYQIKQGKEPELFSTAELNFKY
ncbi:transglycosylase SLT domain-containing protein [Shewanella sp. D64]|nr:MULTISPECIES: transglycosylase SLT domain-containing protein [unclassified Shewanella]MEC4725316.1 transglycosylase SLT domain-containing protein [Shewanella sp. D64]MEC4735838.1 transglycosylase SLT domain-containing protein [Shewanella sp. E94]WBJ93191.1 transglycosylase SLT domain-containing protein [Shewanella sp. MTB7]